jgi:hypothetical protein
MIKTPKPAGPATSALFKRGVPAAILMLVAGVAACSSSHPAASSGAATPSATPTATPTTAHSAATAPGGAATPGAASPTASSTDTAPQKDIIAGLIAFNGKLTLSGAQSLNMSFTAFPGVTSPKSSCAYIGAAGTPGGEGVARQFRIPSPPEGGNVTITGDISPYHGPGTYQKASLVTVGPSVVIGDASYSLHAPGATVAVTFRANGSGEVTFAGAAAATNGQPALSGSIQWSCSVQ